LARLKGRLKNGHTNTNQKKKIKKQIKNQKSTEQKKQNRERNQKREYQTRWAKMGFWDICLAEGQKKKQKRTEPSCITGTMAGGRHPKEALPKNRKGPLGIKVNAVGKG